jgi:hypothetical protein
MDEKHNQIPSSVGLSQYGVNVLALPIAFLNETVLRIVEEHFFHFVLADTMFIVHLFRATRNGGIDFVIASQNGPSCDGIATLGLVGVA